MKKRLHHSLVNAMSKCILVLAVIVYCQFANAQSISFWGTTSDGGASNAGVLFSTDGNGNNQTVAYSFPIENQGANPSYMSLYKATNGLFYGVTPYGGFYNGGVLYAYNADTHTYIVLKDFDDLSGNTPVGGVIQAANGKLYGLTSSGGTDYSGVLYEYDYSNDVYTVLMNFDYGTSGSSPYGSLIEASNGKLYGTTVYGGANGYGVLFEYDLGTDTYTKKMDFDGTTTGNYPYGHLTEVSTGKLYGMTNSGGPNSSTFNGNGVLYAYDFTNDSFTIKKEFNYASGNRPMGSVTLASNGMVYGMTRSGGSAFDHGTLFEFNPDTDTYNVLVNFSESTTGSAPDGDVIESSNGNLYGLTSNGGANGYGVLFEYNISLGSCTVKHHFDNTNGGNPAGSLIEAANGKLLGVTQAGGIADAGVVFEYDVTASSFTKTVDLNYAPMGSKPYAGLLLANNGKLYGTTTTGGVYGNGVIFEYDAATNNVTKKVDFTDGNAAMGNLMQAGNGKIYGMTNSGGTDFGGVLFEYDPVTEGYTIKHNFTDVSGTYPYGQLTEVAPGKLYGTTSSGGTNFTGVIFEYDMNTSTYSKKYEFAEATGAYPYGGLTLAANGKLYGMTNGGGANFSGVIYEYDAATNTYSKVTDLNDVTGNYPYGELIETSPGIFYGTTNGGGTSFSGTILEFNQNNNTASPKVNFDYNNGGLPQAGLMLATNGSLYGMTTDGGTAYNGVFFEYNPGTNMFTKKLDFDGTNGSRPYGNLLEIDSNSFSTDAIPELSANKLVLYKKHGDLVVTTTTDEHLNRVSVYDMTGRSVFEISGEEKTQVEIKTTLNGLIIVNVETTNGNSYTGKIMN